MTSFLGWLPCRKKHIWMEQKILSAPYPGWDTHTWLWFTCAYHVSSRPIIIVRDNWSTKHSHIGRKYFLFAALIIGIKMMTIVGAKHTTKIRVKNITSHPYVFQILYLLLFLLLLENLCLCMNLERHFCRFCTFGIYLISKCYHDNNNNDSKFLVSFCV